MIDANTINRNRDKCMIIEITKVSLPPDEALPFSKLNNN